MNARSILAVVAALVLVTSGISAGAEPGDAPQPDAGAQIEYDETLLRIDVRADGDAAWTIAYRVNLNDENTTAAFESLQEDIRANRSTFESQFGARMNRTARAAENATGREMTIRNVSVTTAIEVTDTGVVRYTFEWTNFAGASGDRLRVGDAIAGTVLDADTTLFVSWPAEYGAVSISPDADERRDGVAIWNGRETFAADEPRIVLGTVTPTPTTDGSGSGTTETTTGDGSGPGTDGSGPGDGTDASPPDGSASPGSPAGGGMNPLLIGFLAVIVGGLAAAAWYVTREGESAGSGVPGSAEPAGGDGGSGGASAASDGAESAASDGTESDGSDEPPAELLSNEERVLRLLEENGGRMKQQQVVQELDWTDAKTSQVVGTLREQDDVEVYRIGRENVLALPGETDL